MRVCASCSRLLSGATCPDDGAAAAEVDIAPPGSRLGRYRITGLLGQGGMGRVYEAVHEVLDRRVAIKMLREEIGDDELPARFLREARAVSRVDHDNVINVTDYADGSGGPVYFVMEYLEGETLLDLVRRSGRLDLALTFHIFDQILAALEAAHGQGYVHRDLKPANVFIVTRESDPCFVKLLDFGLARLVEEGDASPLTAEGMVMGTPEYMSPEQIVGRSATVRSDIYSLGVVLYEAVVGRVPFPAGGSGFHVLGHRVLEEAPAPPRVAAPEADIPEALERVILCALEKDAARRYASVAAMRAALQAARIAAGPRAAYETAAELAPESEAATRLFDGAPTRRRPAPVSLPAPPSPRRSWLWGTLAAAALAAIVASVGITRLGASERGPATGPAAATEPEAAAARPSPWSGEPSAVARRAADELRQRLGSSDPAVREAAAAGLAAAATPAATDLLLVALDGAPQLRLVAADALARLEIFEAAPRIRAVLERSGRGLRVQLAAALARLGDSSAKVILADALSAKEPAARLVAAEALGGEAATRVLDGIFDSTPPGRERWLRAAAALAAAGSQRARDGLAAELTQPDPEPAAAAAAALARTGEPSAVAFLGRACANRSFGARRVAALALADLGRPEALAFVADGLASRHPSDRLAAVAVTARLAGRGGERHAAAVASRADDPDPRVQAAVRAALIAFAP